MAIEVERPGAVQIQHLHSKFAARKVLFIAFGLAVLAALAIVAVSVGASSVGLGDVLRAIGSRLPFANVQCDSLVSAIVWNIRLPRVLMAIVAGMCFAVSGAAMQGTLRNPLASPYTMGISSAAGFGAALAIVLGVSVASGSYVVIANAFLFSLLAALLVFGIARIRGVSPETLILGGIAMMYLFSASTSFLQYVASDSAVAAVVYWLFGSLTSATWRSLLVVSAVLAVSLPPLMRYSWDLNALAAGDEVAASLGVNAGRVRMIVIGLAVLLTATVICFTGIIGFVCLVAPHITRMLIGDDHRFVVPSSCIVGALLLLGADTLGRTVIAPAEIPVGIITSFVGVPLFVYLLLTRKRQYW